MEQQATATAAAAMAQLQPKLYEMPVGLAFVDPSMQQQLDGRISYDAADAAMMQQMYGHQFNQHSMPSALLGRKHAPDRRPLRFWQPFNDWWRSELTRLGRRPTSEEIGEWYVACALCSTLVAMIQPPGNCTGPAQHPYRQYNTTVQLKQ